MHISDKRVPFLALLIAIFIVNDFFFIGARSPLEWLSIDYSSRFLAVLIIACLLKFSGHTYADFGIVRIRWGTFVTWAALLSVTGIVIDQAGLSFFTKVLPNTQLAAFPVIADRYVKIIDLTLGLALVSFTEEAIFRGYFYSVMKTRLKNPALIVAVSAVIFGLIHWSSGLPAVMTTALWGILPMISVIRTGSILPAIFAHFATDLVYFCR